MTLRKEPHAFVGHFVFLFPLRKSWRHALEKVRQKAMSESILRAQSISKSVQDGDTRLNILQDISLEIQAGERLALLGPSGSGKSTLLHILGALDPDYSGVVEVGGQSLGELRESQLAAFRNQRLGFVFQSYNLLGHQTALQNVVLPARFSGTPCNYDKARSMLESVGLKGKGHRKPRHLSGGERQRVAIARALYHEPRLILCDEPTGNLDHETTDDILSIFERLSQEGVAILYATHDPAIERHVHRVLHLDEGKLQ